MTRIVIAADQTKQPIEYGKDNRMTEGHGQRPLIILFNEFYL